MIFGISKYDFWILWKISDRHRCSKKFMIFFFEMKIISQKIKHLKNSIFLEILEKSQNSIRISSKSQNFKYWRFLRNPYRILRFFKNFQKVQKFPKNHFLRNIFHLEKKIKFFLNTYVNVKFHADSKNHT